MPPAAPSRTSDGATRDRPAQEADAHRQEPSEGEAEGAAGARRPEAGPPHRRNGEAGARDSAGRASRSCAGSGAAGLRARLDHVAVAEHALLPPARPPGSVPTAEPLSWRTNAPSRSSTRAWRGAAPGTTTWRPGSDPMAAGVRGNASVSPRRGPERWTKAGVTGLPSLARVVAAFLMTPAAALASASVVEADHRGVAPAHDVASGKFMLIPESAIEWRRRGPGRRGCRPPRGAPVSTRARGRRAARRPRACGSPPGTPPPPPSWRARITVAHHDLQVRPALGQRRQGLGQRPRPLLHLPAPQRDLLHRQRPMAGSFP